MTERFSLIIIGGGSAGFAAATKANDLKLKTALINDGLLGGTCINARGLTIPELVDGVERGSMSMLYAWISESDKIISF